MNYEFISGFAIRPFAFSPVRPLVFSVRSPTVWSVLRHYAQSPHLHIPCGIYLSKRPPRIWYIFFKKPIYIWPVGDIYLGQKPFCRKRSKPPNVGVKKTKILGISSSLPKK